MSLTLKQRLCCLLAATGEEADALLRGRRSALEAAAIGRRVGRTPEEIFQLASSASGIESARIDVNEVTPLQLLQTPGFAATNGSAVMHGFPYYSLQEFEDASQLPRRTVAELFRVPALEQTDKVSGRSRRFEPVYGTYLARQRLDFESSVAIDALGFVEREAGTEVPVRIIRPSETGPRPSVHELKRALGGQAFAVVRDQEGFERYFLPAAIDVWFDATVAETRAMALLGEAGLRVRYSRPRAGYFQGELTVYPYNANLVAMALDKIDEVQRHAEVLFAEPAEAVAEDFAPRHERPIGDFETSASGSRRWNMTLIGVDRAHALTRGSPNVSVVTIDSGIDTAHQDLSAALRPDWASLDLNFHTTESAETRSPLELDVAHGTKVASVVCGRGPGGESRVRGVAPECWLLPLKISGAPSARGYGLRAAAIREALSYLPAGARGVINLSWSTSGEHLGVREALFAASEGGFAIATSAGNFEPGDERRPDLPHYPSRYAYAPGGTPADVRARRRIPGLVSVAAVNAHRRRASYSYYGADSVTLSAPGGEPGHSGTGVFVARPAGGYAYDAGTSFAAPHVAGALALLLSANAALGAQEAVEILRATAQDLDATDPSFSGLLGAGLLDVGAALESALRLAPEPAPPEPAPPEPTLPETMPPESMPSPAASGLPIEINSADEFAFGTLPGIGAWSARAIVAYRARHGPFVAVDDIISSGAVDAWSLTRIEHLLVVGSGASGSPQTGTAPIDVATSGLQPDGPTVDLNRATLEELMTLPMVGAWAAGKVIDHRAAHGPFVAVHDLLLTGAFDPWAVAQLADLVSVRGV